MMVRPPILFHYFGKLTGHVIDHVCHDFATQLLERLRGYSPNSTLLYSPVQLSEPLERAMKRWFTDLNLKINVERGFYRSDKRSFGWTHSFGSSTVYDASTASHTLRFVPWPTDTPPHRSWFGFFRGKEQSEDDKGPFWESLAQCNKEGVTIIVPSKPAVPYQAVAKSASNHGCPLACLPEATIRADQLLQLLDTVPSHILDGSHEHERQLEGYIENQAKTSASGYILSKVWEAFKAGMGPEKLTLHDFEARKSLVKLEGPDANMWHSFYDVWWYILSGIDECRPHVEKLKKELMGAKKAYLSIEMVDELLSRDEHSIYVNYCEKNRECFSYAAVYYGAFWLAPRMALALGFGGFGSSASAAGSDLPEGECGLG